MSSPLSFRPGQIWHDTDGNVINAHGAGMLYHHGTYYWFGEHKIEGTLGNSAQVGVSVYSSADLYRWKNEGIALSVSEDPTHPLIKGCIIERPKVVHCTKTGRFVMWFHYEPAGQDYNGACSGVAIADSPTGPYHFKEIFRPNAGVWPENVSVENLQPLTPAESDQLTAMELLGGPVPYYPRNILYRRDFTGGQMARDMTLFVDDDGQAYQFYASEANGTLHISLLDETFEQPAGRYVRVFPGKFHEAPCVFKYQGRYFMISSHCTGWAANPARVSVADSIWGPWDELGNPCLGPGHLVCNTFSSQGTYVLPVAGMKDAFIFLADRWNENNAIDGRYVWLPLEFKHGCPVMEWHNEWDLSFFEKPTD